MELRHLRYFVAVAEELHFGRAAGRLHVAQPALSQQIQKLERELGVTLLARTRRRVALTEPGRAFLVEARRTLRNAEGAVAAARHAAAGETGRLRIGYIDLAMYLFLPAIVRRYRERYPMVDLTLTEMHREPQRDALRHGDLDLGFFALRADDTELKSELLAVEPLVVMLPATHPAARRKRVPLALLRSDPWILGARELRAHFIDIVLAACAAEGFVPRVVQEANQLNTIGALVRAGLGVTVVPERFARGHQPHAIVRPLKGPAPVHPHHAVWTAEPLPPAAEQFLNIAREVRDANT